VIVVLNQWNVPGRRPEVDRGALRQKFPFIRGFVEMDCKAKKGIPALEAALFREFERMPWVREPFATEWDDVRRAFTAGGTRLTTAAFRNLCLEHGVDDEGQQDHLAGILHHLGVALYDRNRSTVLQPDWLARHLYPLLHLAEVQAGILYQADLEMVLAREHDPAAADCLMRVPEDLGIALPGQARCGRIWLLPHVQPDMPPAGVDPPPGTTGAIRVRFVYQNDPAGLVAQVILRRFDFIEMAGNQKLHWRHGAVLARKGARAVIRSDPQQHGLTLTVTGPGRPRHELAGLCQDELREIHAGLPGLGPVRKIAG